MAERLSAREGPGPDCFMVCSSSSYFSAIEKSTKRNKLDFWFSFLVWGKLSNTGTISETWKHSEPNISGVPTCSLPSSNLNFLKPSEWLTQTSWRFASRSILFTNERSMNVVILPFHHAVVFANILEPSIFGDGGWNMRWKWRRRNAHWC